VGQKSPHGTPPVVTHQIESTAINWEETVYLNFVLQRFSYRLTLDVCEREATVSGRKVAPKVAAAPPLTQTLYHADHAIFCSPSRRSMSDKGHADAMTYPDLYFTLDCFDDVFAAIEVPPESVFRLEMVAVASKVCCGLAAAFVSRLCVLLGWLTLVCHCVLQRAGLPRRTPRDVCSTRHR
jgi:hypothetical protein